MVRDSLRKKVYDTEEAVFKNNRSIILSYNSLIDIQLFFINDILSSRYWKKNYPDIEVIFLYNQKRNSKHAWGGVNEIYLPKMFRNQLYIIHEIAHVVCYHVFNGYGDTIPFHGLEFLDVYTKLVKVYINCDVYQDFVEKLADKGVEV